MIRYYSSQLIFYLINSRKLQVFRPLMTSIILFVIINFNLSGKYICRMKWEYETETYRRIQRINRV